MNSNIDSNLKRNIVTSLLVLVVFNMIVYGGKITPTKWISPLSSHSNAFDAVKEKITTRENTYSLSTFGSITLPSDDDMAAYKSAHSYAVVDMENGQLIYSKQSPDKMPIASLTKIMTAVVAMDLATPEDQFSVSRHAADTIPTKIVMQPGEKYTLHELLYAMLLTSANDAAEVIKEGVNTKYQDDVFIRAMNEKAKFIGLKQTHFANPQGFDDPNNYSSAEDLAVLSYYALTNYPLIRDIVKEDHYVLGANQNHGEHYLNNWNGLIGVYPNVSGIKIGNTDSAGTTTAVVSERNGKKLLVVVLGTGNVLERDLAAAELLDYGFEKTSGLQAIKVTADQLREKYATWKYYN